MISAINYKDELLEIGINKRYHEFNPDEIIEKNQIDNYLKNIKDNFKKGRGLLIIGSIGCGKTTALSYIAKHIIKINEETKNKRQENGILEIPEINMKYLTLQKINKILFDYYYNNEWSEINKINNSKLIFIDDFNIKNDDKIEMVRKIIEFIEQLYSRKKIIIITSNLTILDLKERKSYSHILDRIKEMCYIIESKNGSKRKNLEGLL